MVTEIEILEALKEPFPEKDIEWRVQSSGVKNGKPWARILAYVTNRAIMERLDQVFGIFGWQNEYRPAPCGGVLCGIKVKNPTTGEWIEKWDGAENTQVESVKGGLSSASKRCATNFGISRYLYELGESWADFTPNGRFSCRIKKDNQDQYGTMFKWNPPRLPVWALPKVKDNVVLEQQFTALMNQTPEGERAQWSEQWKGAKTPADKGQILIAFKAFGGKNG